VCDVGAGASEVVPAVGEEEPEYDNESFDNGALAASPAKPLQDEEKSSEQETHTMQSNSYEEEGSMMLAGIKS
jgi:hypothetical protein